MKVTFDNQPLPRWTARVFCPNMNTVTYRYKGGLLQEATLSQFWTGIDLVEYDFTRVLRWDDVSDMRLLRHETGLPLEHATDLAEMKDQYLGSSFVLYAHYDNNDPAMVILDRTLNGLGIVADHDGSPGYEPDEDLTTD